MKKLLLFALITFLSYTSKAQALVVTESEGMYVSLNTMKFQNEDKEIQISFDQFTPHALEINSTESIYQWDISNHDESRIYIHTKDNSKGNPKIVGVYQLFIFKNKQNKYQFMLKEESTGIKYFSFF